MPPSVGSAIRVMVAARVRLYREGLAQLLARDPRLLVVGSCGADDDCLAAARSTRADVLVLDLHVDAGRALVTQLREADVRMKIVVIGASDREKDVISWATSGISGYVTRDESLDDLVEAVVCSVRGELHCTPRVAAALLKHVAAAGVGGLVRSAAQLTPREVEITGLIAEGLANKEIALRLHIERATVKNHVHNILEKVGARTRTEAAALVRHHGLITL